MSSMALTLILIEDRKIYSKMASWEGEPSSVSHRAALTGFAFQAWEFQVLSRPALQVTLLWLPGPGL